MAWRLTPEFSSRREATVGCNVELGVSAPEETKEIEMQYMAQIQGGVGPDLWDKECFIDAENFADAAHLAGAKADYLGGQVTLLEQCDCSEADALDRAVSRFLTWPLPDTVCPDACTVNKRQSGQIPPTGTNLLTAIEAREMLRHVHGL